MAGGAPSQVFQEDTRTVMALEWHRPLLAQRARTAAHDPPHGSDLDKRERGNARAAGGRSWSSRSQDGDADYFHPDATVFLSEAVKVIDATLPEIDGKERVARPARWTKNRGLSRWDKRPEA